MPALRPIEILLNGEQQAVLCSTVAELLAALGLADRKVAVELNKSIVRRSDFESTPVVAGDSIELVHFVGGG